MDRRTVHQRVDVALAQQQHAGELVDIFDIQAAQVALDLDILFLQLPQVHLRRLRRAHQDNEVGRKLSEIPRCGVSEDIVERGDQGA